MARMALSMAAQTILNAPLNILIDNPHRLTDVYFNALQGFYPTKCPTRQNARKDPPQVPARLIDKRAPSRDMDQVLLTYTLIRLSTDLHNNKTKVDTFFQLGLTKKQLFKFIHK